MELFSLFDDSVFEESRIKDSAAALPQYEPKSCQPEWFCHRKTFEDVLDEQKMMKFRGDLKYRKKQYQSAIDDYTSCLSLVPDNNLSVRRDVLEGLARCWSCLGKREEALEYCEKLRKEATNTCHLTCIFHLELSIYEACGDLKNTVSSLKQLCALHPYNQWHWFKLGTTYQRLLENLTESNVQMQNKTARWKACMCLIRTRLLIEILKIQQFSFVLERSERALKDIEERLEKLQLNEEALQIVSEVMAKDINPEKMREENQDGESLTGFSVKDFDERWWNKLHACLLKDEKTHVSSSNTEDTSGT